MDSDLSSNYISLSEAANRSKYSQEYLSLRARQGKLKALKFGRNWVTTPGWLEDYLYATEESMNQLKQITEVAKPINTEPVFEHHPAAIGQILDKRDPRSLQTEKIIDQPDPRSTFKSSWLDHNTVTTKNTQRIETAANEIVAANQSDISEPGDDFWSQPAFKSREVPLANQSKNRLLKAGLSPMTMNNPSFGFNRVTNEQSTEVETNSSPQFSIPIRKTVSNAAARKIIEVSKPTVIEPVDRSIGQFFANMFEPAAFATIVGLIIFGFILFDQPLQIRKNIATGFGVATGQVKTDSTSRLAFESGQLVSVTKPKEQSGRVAGTNAEKRRLSVLQTIALGVVSVLPNDEYGSGPVGTLLSETFDLPELNQ